MLFNFKYVSTLFPFCLSAILLRLLWPWQRFVLHLEFLWTNHCSFWNASVHMVQDLKPCYITLKRGFTNNSSPERGSHLVYAAWCCKSSKCYLQLLLRLLFKVRIVYLQGIMKWLSTICPPDLGVVYIGAETLERSGCAKRMLVLHVTSVRHCFHILHYWGACCQHLLNNQW